MILIKIFLITSIALSLLLLAYSKRLRNMNKFVSIILFTLGSFLIIFPTVSDRVANIFGIGKGSDLIIYISITVLLLLVAILYSKEASTNRYITILVRNKAIEKAKKL